MNRIPESIKINIFDYYSPEESIKVFRTGENTSIIDRISNDVNIDFVKLYPILASVSRYSINIYFYLLNKLESSELPITIHNITIKKEATGLNNRKTFEVHLNDLVRLGLIFHPDKRKFYINPVYAWKGSYERMFDIDRLPYYSTEQVELMKQKYAS